MARTIPSVHVICGTAPADLGGKTKSALFQAGPWFDEPADGVASAKRAPDNNGVLPVIRVTNKIDIFACHDGPVPSLASGVLHLLRAADGPHDLYVKPGDGFIWTAATA